LYAFANPAFRSGDQQPDLFLRISAGVFVFLAYLSLLMFIWWRLQVVIRSVKQRIELHPQITPFGAYATPVCFVN
jgi:hypothetical protein